MLVHCSLHAIYSVSFTIIEGFEFLYGNRVTTTQSFCSGCAGVLISEIAQSLEWIMGLCLLKVRVKSLCASVIMSLFAEHVAFNRRNRGLWSLLHYHSHKYLTVRFCVSVRCWLSWLPNCRLNEQRVFLSGLHSDVIVSTVGSQQAGPWFESRQGSFYEFVC